jgi:diguanylate cyclase (GGDEF)-like protein
MLDMEARLGWARAVMYGSLAVAFAAGIPWMGPGIVFLLAGSALGYALLRPRMARSATPEYVLATSIVNAQVIIAVGIALTGGPHSPALPILLLPIVTLPARFSARGVIAGVSVTVALLLAATVGADPTAFADDPTFTLVALACIPGLAAFSYVLMRSEIEQRADAVLDPLTGLLNRKALAHRFAELAEQARLTGSPVCVVACDLDHFKAVNDEFGHERGDVVLRTAAYAMRKSLRSFELAYRLGGEEFLVVLPGSTLDDGLGVAERIRAALEEQRVGGRPVTGSLGVAAAFGADVDLEALSRQADAALYRAKRDGRNRVVAADPSVDVAPYQPILPGAA